MNSTRQSTRSNSRVIVRTMQKQSQLGQSFVRKVRQTVNRRLGNKYCTCENYMAISEMNRTILDKQCVLKTTLSDIKHNREEQVMQNYYSRQNSASQLPELIEYYKYYSQKSILFPKDYFILLYQYHQKRKIIEYNRLKVLLNLSDSQNPSKSSKNNVNIQDSITPPKQKIGISRNFNTHQDETKKNYKYQGFNILNELDLSQFQSIIQNKNSNQQSLLINRLRNNLSKHIGSTKIKNLSIEQLDKYFDFQKKDQNFNPINQNSDCYFFQNGKQKDKYQKTKKYVREPTNPNIIEQVKQKDLIRKRSGKRNNSCENLAKQFHTKSPYEPLNNKLRRKKNLSMDNINTYTSTLYLPDERKETNKSRKLQIQSRDKQQCLRQKPNTLLTRGPEMFMESISDLKSKIKKQKQKLMKTSLGCNYTSLKRQKGSYATLNIGQKGNCLPLNSVNQKLSKKPFEKLRQKIMNAY